MKTCTPADQPSDAWFARQLEPWFGVIKIVFQAAERDCLAAIPLLGLPKKTERANDFHRAVRAHLDRVCQESEPLLVLREGADGEGLDYLVCKMEPDQPFGIRWGKDGPDGVRRNRTRRSQAIQEQGYLWGADGEIQDDLPMVTLGYSIADDYSLAGQPCWWVDRVTLLRERDGRSDFITEVALFESPDQRVLEFPDRDPLIRARDDEYQKIVRLVQRIRSDAG